MTGSADAHARARDDVDYDATLEAVQTALTDETVAAASASKWFRRAFAAGQPPRDQAAYAAGREDGGKGASFRPLHFHAFSYASGYVHGQLFGRKINGG